MIILSKEIAINAHAEVILETGGESGLRDEGLLEAAITAPFQTYGEVDLFPSLAEKAARIAFGIIKNHPFLDGNKRTGTLLMLLLLKANRVVLTYDHHDLIGTINAVAEGSIGTEELTAWIVSHSSQ